jgi:putative IMPACT (imprinted ancient) family translation regulator
MQKLVYTTVQEKFMYEIPKIKGSRFFGTIFPVETREEADQIF